MFFAAQATFQCAHTDPAKLARIEGMDFIVDSLGMKINDNLIEHIDGLRTYYKVNINSDSDNEE